jgi:hypothetical protein
MIPAVPKKRSDCLRLRTSGQCRQLGTEDRVAQRQASSLFKASFVIVIVILILR